MVQRMKQNVFKKMTLSSILLKFHRLRAMSLPEIFYRARRDYKDRCEKKNLASWQSFEQFTRRQRLRGMRARAGSGDTLLEQLGVERPLPWQKHSADELNLFFDTLPAHRAATIAKAERLIRNEITVFNQTVKWDGDIDWHWDFLKEKTIPVIYWKEINYWDSRVVREVKYTWELNRHQHFVTLAKAFLLTTDEKYAQVLFEQWEDWIERNPYLFGINWSSALECAIRLISWTWALQMAKHSRFLTNDLYFKILHSIELHARYISRHLSRFSSANNHIIGEAVGLIYAGTYFPALRQASHWRALGWDLFQKEFLLQVHPDGVTKEQAIYYQTYVFYFAVLTKLALEYKKRSFPNRLERLLQKMAFFIACIRDNGGTIPQIGDEDGGSAFRPIDLESDPYEAILGVAGALGSEQYIDAMQSSSREAIFWLTGQTLTAKQPLWSRPELARFPDGGYVIVHSNNDDLPQHLIWDCGPLGYGDLAAHGHADVLSFTLTVMNQPVLIDCGTFLYLGAGDLRKYFRSARAHNILRVDDLDPSPLLGPFQWGRKATGVLESIEQNGADIVIRGCHDGYQKLDITHQREIRKLSSDWLVADRVQGTGTHLVELFFHLENCQTKVSYNQVFCEYGAFCVTFSFESSERIFLSVLRGEEPESCCWRSPRFGEKIKHPVIRLQVKTDLPAEIKSRIQVSR